MKTQVEEEEYDINGGAVPKEDFKTAFRRRIFQIYNEMMAARNTDMTTAIVLLAVNFIQIYGLIYDTRVGFPFKDDLFQYIASICDVIRLYPLLELYSATAYYGVAFAFLAILLIYTTLLFVTDYLIETQSTKLLTVPVQLLSFLSTLLFWVFMMPIFETYIAIFDCKTGGTHRIDTGLECLGGLHIFLCVLFTMTLAGFLAIFVLIALFFNESRPNHTNALRRLDLNLELYIVMFKFIIVILTHFLREDSWQWLLVVAHLVFSSYFSHVWYKYLPYYNIATSVIFGACWINYFWISANLLLLKALEGTNRYQGQTIVIIIGIILMFPLTYQIRERKILSMLYNQRHDKMKTEYQLDIYINKMHRLIIDSDLNESDQLVLVGIINNHKLECLNPECPLIYTDKELYLPSLDAVSDRKSPENKDIIVLYHLIQSIYSEYARNTTTSSAAVLHISYAYFLMFQVGNFHTAVHELYAALKCEINYQQSFTIFRFIKLIEQHLGKKYGKNAIASRDAAKNGQSIADLDVSIVIIFENLFEKLNKEIEKSASDHIEFWSHFESLMMDLNVLHKLGLNIINSTKRINDIWRQLTRINSNYPKALHLYGNYLIQIKNDLTEGDENIMRANTARHAQSLLKENNKNDGAPSNATLTNQFDLMFADDTVVIIISGNKETQAKILKTNSGITKLFGYNMLEVIGHDVSIIQPPIVSRKHNLFLEQYFRTGRERIINVSVPTFAMQRSGHIFPMNVIVRPVPSLKNDIQIIGLIQPSKKNDFEYILTDLSGRIDCISKGITTLLQVQPAFFKDNEIFIQVLCPQLFEVERDSKTKVQNTHFNTWTYPTGSDKPSFKDLTYIIPRNLINICQKGVAGKTSLAEQPGKKAEFIGVRSAESLKMVSNMFRNQQYDDQPKKYAQNILSHINYENPDIIKGPIRTEIVETNYGNGILKFRIFKLLLPKGKNGLLGLRGEGWDSDSENSGANAGQGSGEKNLKAMIEDTKRAIALSETSSMDLELRILKMKTAFEMIKRGIRHASLRAKPSNIITPHDFEKQEMLAYSTEIRHFESQLRNMKVAVGHAAAQQNFDLLQVDQNADYQKIKGAFPLKSNQHLEPPGAMGEQKISVTEISGGFQSQNPPESPKGEEVQKEPPGREEKEDEDNPIDLLKVLRAQPGFNSAGPILPINNKKADGPAGETSDVKDDKEKEGEDKNADLLAEEEKFLTEDTGSVSSGTQSIAQHLRMLRSALFENYIPPSIQNLQINARIVFVALFVLTLFQYIYSKSIYSQLNDNLANIYSSKNRMISLNNIGADSRALSALSTGLINKTRGGTRDYEKFKRDRIGDSVNLLQGSQNNLSQTYLLDVFETANKNLINSPSVQLIFNSPASLPMFQHLDIWSSLMTLSIHALSIQLLPLPLISRNDDTSVFFVLTNTFNSVLQAISESTQALLQESQNISKSVYQTLMYLLIAASCALSVSLCLILPVAMQVDKDKDELLKHFMLIDREDVMKQLEKCRLFFNSMHDKEHGGGMIEGQDDDIGIEESVGNQEQPDGTPGEAGEEQQHKVKKSRKGKMHKNYSNNFLVLFLKFFVVLTILEGYFVLIFVQSGDFLDVALNLIRESGTITIRHFGNNFLYQIMQEVLTTNGMVQVMNQNSLTFMFSYLNKTIRDQENFLKEHDANSAYHSTEFNTFFDKLIYQNACASISLNKETECESFMGGILKKGLYSANVAYWDNMRSMATDFNNSQRSTFNSSIILNSGRMIENEILKDQYLEKAYSDLLYMLNDSIRYNFNQRDSQDTILFACYIVILFMLYFIIWKKFMETTRHSLWVTKSMLAIIPLDIIQKVPKIKDFLLASSQSNL